MYLHHLSFDGTPTSTRLLVRDSPQRDSWCSLDLSALKSRRRHGSPKRLVRVDRTNQYRTSHWAYKMASGDLFILFLSWKRERERFFLSYMKFFFADYQVLLFPNSLSLFSSNPQIPSFKISCIPKILIFFVFEIIFLILYTFEKKIF